MAAYVQNIGIFPPFCGGICRIYNRRNENYPYNVGVKYLIYEVRKLLHPKGVFNITIGENTIGDNVVRATLGFYLFYILIFVFTAMVLSMTGLDVTTALTASASAIGNIGPGLGSIGPTDNWGHLTDLAKWLTSFCMLLGRLEIFTVVVLFSRSFWK